MPKICLCLTIYVILNQTCKFFVIIVSCQIKKIMLTVECRSYHVKTSTYIKTKCQELNNLSPLPTSPKQQGRYYFLFFTFSKNVLKIHLHLCSSNTNIFLCGRLKLSSKCLELLIEWKNDDDWYSFRQTRERFFHCFILNKWIKLET